MFVAQLFLQPLQLGARRFLRFGFAVGFIGGAVALVFFVRYVMRLPG